MKKSSFFFGQSVFGRLISFINPNLVNRAVKKHNSDYRTKSCGQLRVPANCGIMTNKKGEHVLPFFIHFVWLRMAK